MVAKLNVDLFCFFDLHVKGDFPFNIPSFARLLRPILRYTDILQSYLEILLRQNNNPVCCYIIISACDEIHYSHRQ